MSTLRNTAARLWQGSHVRKANLVLGVTGAILSAACAAEQAVAPVAASPQRLSADRARQGAAFDSERDEKQSPTDKAAADAAKKAANAVSKAQMDSLKADWEAYKRAVKAGTVDVDFVRCEPKPEVSVTKVIGPKGGAFNIGPNKFEVPAGAVDSNVTITATMPTKSIAELEFEPHGLQFNKPVQMTISYKGCVVPDSATLGVSYITHPWQSAVALRGASTQRMPAHDDKATTTISALTDHFSGYVVAWSRQ